MNRVLLDTCILIDAAQGDLKPSARILLGRATTVRTLSAISMTEIAIKTSIGKLNIPDERLLQMLEDLMITVIPHTARHARRLYGLPLHHREPFDRMLIATALVEDIPVLTSDGEFLKYRDIGLKVIRA